MRPPQELKRIGINIGGRRDFSYNIFPARGECRVFRCRTLPYSLFPISLFFLFIDFSLFFCFFKNDARRAQDCNLWSVVCKVWCNIDSTENTFFFDEKSAKEDDFSANEVDKSAFEVDKSAIEVDKSAKENDLSAIEVDKSANEVDKSALESAQIALESAQNAAFFAKKGA